LDAIRTMLKRSGLADIATSGLPPQQINLIKELTRQDGLTLNELSARMGLAHSTISGIVDRLEHKKLVHRRPDPQNRRYIRICLDQAVGEVYKPPFPITKDNPVGGRAGARSAT